MNKLILLLGVLACLVAVQARHFTERSAEESSLDEEVFRPKERGNRHRRRRWQSNYGYDNPPPSYYYPERRNDRDQELVQNIYRLLEDINVYIRRTPPPPPPPQPIYIPYPVSYPVRVNCRVNKPRNTTNDPVPERRGPPSMEDTNQNWGLVMPMLEVDYEDESDGARPISFEPLVPKQFLARPAPKVEHGSQQVQQSPPAILPISKAPAALVLSQSSSSKPSVPGMCNAAILSCCGFSGDKARQIQCFANIGCASSYDDGSACSEESIQRSLESFRVAYSPVA